MFNSKSIVNDNVNKMQKTTTTTIPTNKNYKKNTKNYNTYKNDTKNYYTMNYNTTNYNNYNTSRVSFNELICVPELS